MLKENFENYIFIEMKSIFPNPLFSAFKIKKMCASFHSRGSIKCTFISLNEYERKSNWTRVAKMNETNKSINPTAQDKLKIFELPHMYRFTSAFCVFISKVAVLRKRYKCLT